MSGKPYPEGVAKVVELLDQQASVVLRIAELAPTVKQLTDELNAAVATRNSLSVAISDLLASMDLSSQGNYGFGGRMGWFLAEFRKRILAGQGT
jgi:uncharacterized protein YoxC